MLAVRGGKIRARYARYVDDMIIIASSPEILMKIKSEDCVTVI